MRALMQSQHKSILKELKSARHDDRITEFFAARGEQLDGAVAGAPWTRWISTRRRTAGGDAGHAPAHIRGHLRRRAHHAGSGVAGDDGRIGGRAADGSRAARSRARSPTADPDERIAPRSRRPR